MDTCSAAEVAHRLETTVPRVVRAVQRLSLEARKANGHLALTPTMVERLRAELGVTPRVPGLDATEVKVLAALSRAPLGLASVRIVADHASVSPTAAAKALRRLEAKRLKYRREAVIAGARARRVELLHANRRAERWLEIAPALARVQPPRYSKHRHDQRVPRWLRHLFWNTAPAQLEVSRGGPYIARRLLRTMDLDGLAWGARNLRSSDWEQAARARGLDPSVRALAHNLAGKRDG